MLPVVTWLYLAWSMAPILIAARASLDASGHPASPSGFTLDAYRAILADAELRRPYLVSVRVALATAALATPLGAAMALGLQRWRGRTSTTASAMVALAVVTPQIALGAALFYLLAFVTRYPLLDQRAVLLGHITLAIPFVVVVVRSRLLSIGRSIEEQAMDLGASPAEAVRRVTLPLMVPALLVGAVVAFTISFDNFVLSDRLCLFDSCRTVPTMLYGGRASLELDPVVLALGTAAAVTSITSLALVLLARKAFRRASGWREGRLLGSRVGLP